MIYPREDPSSWLILSKYVRYGSPLLQERSRGEVLSGNLSLGVPISEWLTVNLFSILKILLIEFSTKSRNVSA